MTDFQRTTPLVASSTSEMTSTKLTMYSSPRSPFFNTIFLTCEPSQRERYQLLRRKTDQHRVSFTSCSCTFVLKFRERASSALISFCSGEQLVSGAILTWTLLSAAQPWACVSGSMKFHCISDDRIEPIHTENMSALALGWMNSLDRHVFLLLASHPEHLKPRCETLNL